MAATKLRGELSDCRGTKRKRSAERRLPAAGRPDSSVPAATLLGAASETQEAHIRRHDGGLAVCPRCRWYAQGDEWARAYGSVEARAGPRAITVWASERPALYGEAWALGCSLCAEALRRGLVGARSPESGRPRVGQPKRTATAWARYEVRPLTLQASHLAQHVRSDVHKMAVESFFRPEEPTRIALQLTSSDDRLLAGAAPQPADWLRAFRAVRSPSSWRSAAAISQTEHFIHQIRGQPVRPRTIANMVLVLRETVREEKRQWLRDCSSIWIAVDDRLSRRLLTFKCDSLAAPQGEGPHTKDPTWGIGARKGIVGCVLVREQEIEDFWWWWWRVVK